jgi:hypothetical protein
MQAIFEPRYFAALCPEQAGQPSHLVPERQAIREWLLELDDTLPPRPFPETAILGLNLHRHWRAEHRTALWFPQPYNNCWVKEIYLRYGKSRSEIKALKKLIPSLPGEPSGLGGFPAHVHLSVGLASGAFLYQLVIGPRAWLDMNNMKDLIHSCTQQTTDLWSALSSLDAAGYKIWRGGSRREIKTFESTQDIGNFLQCPTIAKLSKDWFAIRKQVDPTDGNLTVSSQDLQTELQRLYPVFDLIARKPSASMQTLPAA